MSTILISADAGLWDRPPLRNLFDRREEKAETVLQDYEVVIPGDNMRQLILVQKLGVKVALRCTDLDSLIFWRGRGIDMDILFAPSALAALEADLRTRQTLVLTRDMAHGETITDNCIATTLGGTGLGWQYRILVTGLRALYPLKAGTAIDFGLLG
jgi:hypothetical protein